MLKKFKKKLIRLKFQGEDNFHLLFLLSIVSLLVFYLSFRYSWNADGKFNTQKNQITPINHQLDNQTLNIPVKYNLSALVPISDMDIKNQIKGIVTIIEYGDFTCPVSKQQHEILLHLANQYPQINLIFRNFPQKFHKYADNEAIYVYCLAQNQKSTAWSGVNQLFTTSQASGIGRQFVELEKILNVSDETKACVKNNETKKELEKQLEKVGEVGIAGTPNMVLLEGNSQPLILSGLYKNDELKELLKLN